jgi:eukaryotic-like serine/threonine-protein kinase
MGASWSEDTIVFAAGSPSPLFRRVAYSSYPTGNTDIFERRADAGQDEAPLVSTARNERISDWSGDNHILYSVFDPKNGHDLWCVKRTTTGKLASYPLLQTASNERLAKLSPDGRYLAYVSDESGRNELYVRPFQSGSRKWSVSSHGASQVR